MSQLLEPFLLAKREEYDRRWPGLLDTLPDVVELPSGYIFGQDVLANIEMRCHEIRAGKIADVISIPKASVSPERQLILSAIEELGGCNVSASQIAERTGKERTNLSHTLRKMSSGYDPVVKRTSNGSGGYVYSLLGHQGQETA